MAIEGLSEFERIYSAGHLLFEQDEPGSRMYILKKGQVRIFRTVGGEELLLALLGPGEFFGEMALLEGLPRSASARTETACILVEVEGPTFGKMIRQNGEIAARLMCKLAARVRELDQRVQHLYADRGVGRAVEVLSFLLPSRGELRVPAADLRKAVHERTGLMPWQVDAVVADMERAGCLRSDDEDLVVQSRDRLKEYARFLELRRKYEGADAEVSDATRVGMDRLLRALDLNDDEVERNQTVLARHYQDYLELKRRFG